MRKDEYLNILSERLKVLPLEEYNDIMEYYREYFEDAGVENEEAVIKELGDVEMLAAKIIKENMGEEDNDNSMTAKIPDINNAGYSNSHIYNQNIPSYTPSYTTYQQPKQGMSTGWKAAIALLTFPIWIGLVAAVFGTIFGFGVAAVACFVAGIATIVAGFSVIGISVWTCLLFIGGGFIVIAVSLVFLMASIGLAHVTGKALKAIFGNKQEPKHIEI